MDFAASSVALLHARTAALVALFEHVRCTRMEGVPILNPALNVAAIGFEVSNRSLALVPYAQEAINTVASNKPENAAEPPMDIPFAVGILITPWCMNLIRFPLTRVDAPQRSGTTRSHGVGAERFDFIAGHEDSFGSYDACSLFSPMFEFPDQATAAATAHAVLETLRRTASPVPPLPAVTRTPAVADRRAFLFGRRPSAAGVAP